MFTCDACGKGYGSRKKAQHCEEEHKHGPKDDAVNHPSHYTLGGVEVIDAIEAWELGYNLGNAVKYIARAGKKDPNKEVEDLKKGAFYLQRQIDNLSAKK